MELSRRNVLVYGLLAAVWALVVIWQVEEHLRVREAARTDLRRGARAVTRTLSASIRGMRFRGAVRLESLQPLLAELVNARADEPVKSTEIISVALLNAAGEKLAEAGRIMDTEQKELVQEGERWGAHSVVLINPADLGTSLSEGVTNPTVVVLPSDRTNRPPDSGREFRRGQGGSEAATNQPAAGNTNPPPALAASNPPAGTNLPSELATTNPAANEVGASLGSSNGPPGESRDARPPGFRRRSFSWMRFVDPSVVERRSLHGLVPGMSTASLEAASARDFWLRIIIVGLATLSALGSCLTWRNFARTSELQIRLVRASEMNTHLKEMNLAAAGLAHETRNPLNIIRGLAQMISKQADAEPEIRKKSREILDETDKVTAQLNEFINYARPREIRASSLVLGSVVAEVVRALNYDLQEKEIKLQVNVDPVHVSADEQLLRQTLFNLLLNAIQAVDKAGEIVVAASKSSPTEVALEVRDNGPGVPPDRRAEIFKPYFTTQKQGTGLGLAVVQQIVLAHGWEIQCVPNEPKGALFRITHLKLAA